jgi:hypothetical protein
MEEQLNSITTIIGFLTSHQNLGVFCEEIRKCDVDIKKWNIN